MQRPEATDGVLGGQTPPPIASAMLGGIAGLQQWMAIAPPEERSHLLTTALNYGEAGIDFLIATLKDDPVLTVRATAYQLLQSVDSTKAKTAIANGILLNPGDRIYCVYKSAVSYNDEFYNFETTVWEHPSDLEEAFENQGLNWEEEGYDSYEEFYEAYKEERESYIPERIFSSVHKVEAEAVAQKIHQHELSNWHILDFNISHRRNENFDLEEWCKANNIPYQDGWVTEQEFVETLRLRFLEACRDSNDSSEVQKIIFNLTKAMRPPFVLGEWCTNNNVPYETSSDGWESILEQLKSTENYELLGKLWQDAVGSFAFVQEQIIQEKKYLKDEGNLNAWT